MKHNGNIEKAQISEGNSSILGKSLNMFDSGLPYMHL